MEFGEGKRGLIRKIRKQPIDPMLSKQEKEMIKRHREAVIENIKNPPRGGGRRGRIKH